MKRYLLIILFLNAAFAVSAQQAWTDRTRLLPDQLRNIQTGILLYHNPTPVYPELNTDAQGTGKYIWKHSTHAMAQTEDLEVVAAGSYIWFGDKGWITNIKLSQEEFAQKFNCKSGILKKGVNYTYKHNYRYGNVIFAGDALWFIIAKNKSGQLFKGFAIVETEGELKSVTNKN